MITTKEVKVRIPNELTSNYIDNELKKLNLDVLRWAITSYDKEFYTINLAIVED